MKAKISIIEKKAYEAIPERRYDTPHGNLDINSDYRDKWIEGYLTAKKDLLVIFKDFIKKRGNDFVNSEYNEFHHGIEYDGTIDKEKMIKEIEATLKEYFKAKYDIEI